MQKDNLGTKATRAGIIQTLYDRKYIADERIAVTDVGFEVVNVLQKHCPTVLSSALTAELEEKMSANPRTKRNKTARREPRQSKLLKTATTKLKENEDAIGKQLSQALTEFQLEERTVGACPTCKTGKLVIIHSKATGKRFVGCTNYFQGTCKTAFPLPQRGIVKPLRSVCKSCGYPTVRVWQRGRRSWTLCLNSACPSKKEKTAKT